MRGKNPGDQERVNCSPTMLLDVYRELPHPSVRTCHAELTRRGIKCSVAWVRLKIRQWDIVIKSKVENPHVDPTTATIRQISGQLTALGTGYEPLKVLRGLQRHLTAKIAKAMMDNTTKPEWFQEMMKLYGQLEDEATRTYQNRKAAGIADKMPETAPDKDSDRVVKFSKKGLGK